MEKSTAKANLDCVAQILKRRRDKEHVARAMAMTSWPQQCSCDATGGGCSLMLCFVRCFACGMIHRTASSMILHIHWFRHSR